MSGSRKYSIHRIPTEILNQSLWKVFDVSLEMSDDPKNFRRNVYMHIFVFTFDEVTELDCRAFSLFRTATGSLISQILSDVMLYTSGHDLSKLVLCKTEIIFRIA